MGALAYMLRALLSPSSQEFDYSLALVIEVVVSAKPFSVYVSCSSKRSRIHAPLLAMLPPSCWRVVRKIFTSLILAITHHAWYPCAWSSICPTSIFPPLSLLCLRWVCCPPYVLPAFLFIAVNQKIVPLSLRGFIVLVPHELVPSSPFSRVLFSLPV